MPKVTEEEKSKATRDHEIIRRWAEIRGGHPARVRIMSGTSTGTRGGLLRIDFWEGEINLEPISWDDFFAVFDHHKFIFLYQDEMNGKLSRFYSIVQRGTFHTVEEAKEAADERFEGADPAVLEDAEEGKDEAI